MMSLGDKKDYIYTPFYCEENIYKLGESLSPEKKDECYVVFISNSKEITPLWKQRIGNPEEDHMVCWDYHVILIQRSASDKLNNNDCSTFDSQVYDFDTVLPFPVQFSQYFNSVFRPKCVSEQFVQQFRVIKICDYLATFSSDRSRMKKPDGTFIEPPPEYDPIHNGNVSNNLNNFISMLPGFTCGNVLTLSQLYDMFS